MNIDGGSTNLELIIHITEGGQIDLKCTDGSTTLYTSSESSTWPFTMFAPEGSPACSDVEYRPLNLNPGSEENISYIEKTFLRCYQEHATCMELRKAHRQGRPSRLIAVGDLGDKNIRIWVPRSADLIEYAVLSYCWGGDQESKTTSARLEQRCNGFPLDSLPQTLQDAIIVTRRLGLKYLWVDAICIIQDDDSDKNLEIKKMGHIYQGASVTVVAARASEVSEGFLHDREPNQCYRADQEPNDCCRTDQEPNDCYGTVCQIKYRKSPLHTAVVKSGFVCEAPLGITFDDPIDSRGWTFQERYQSLCTISFGRRQTVWSCSQGLAHRWVDGGINEAFEDRERRRFTGMINNPPYRHALHNPKYHKKLNSVLGDWQRLVEEYSIRDFTIPTDRLPAFAAMAKGFGTFLGLDPKQYLAGLWDFDLSMQLRWRRPEPESEIWKRWLAARSNKASTEKWTGSPGPSWSWASSEYPVIFGDDRRFFLEKEKLKLLGREVKEKLEGFSFGEVLWARLRVSGNIFVAYRQKSGFTVKHPNLNRFFPIPLDVYWDRADEHPSMFWCLETHATDSKASQNSSGLLLVRTDQGDRLDPNQYRRVGYFEVDQSTALPELPEFQGRSYLSKTSTYQTVYII